MAYSAHAPLLARIEAAPRLPALSVMALRVAVIAADWSMRTRTRRHLREIDPHILKDIGITPQQALIESHRKFWQ